MRTLRQFSPFATVPKKMASARRASRVEQLITVFESLNLPKDEKKQLKEWVENSKDYIEILITGRTGVGKSTLLNALVGADTAATGDKLRVETKKVISHKVTVEGVDVIVWDSPGLEDGSGMETQYLEELKKKCGNVDIVIYCIDVAATRAELAGVNEEQKDLGAIKKLTATFGPRWWEHSIFVMTRANLLESTLKYTPNPEEMFNARLEDWQKRIHAALVKANVPEIIAKNVPVKPAGHTTKPDLPGRDLWLSKLWFDFVKRVKINSQPTLTRVNLLRLRKENNFSLDDFKKAGYEQPIAVAAGVALVGGAVGGAVGYGASLLVTLHRK